MITNPRRAVLSAVAVLCVSTFLVRPVDAQTADPRAAFERLKSLAGTWDGQPGPNGMPAPTVVYRVASGGSVVEETLFPGTPHEMISMYHIADGQLVMTHYCSAGNQPRMRLDTKASTPDSLVFAFDGGTGFDPAKDAHIHSGVIQLKGDALLNTWSNWKDGKPAGEHRFALQRRK